MSELFPNEGAIVKADPILILKQTNPPSVDGRQRNAIQ